MVTNIEDITEDTGFEGVTAIAIIDDVFIPVSIKQLPEWERDAVILFLSELDEPLAIEDIANRGVDKITLSEKPDDAVEALTDLEHGLGIAFPNLAPLLD